MHSAHNAFQLHAFRSHTCILVAVHVGRHAAQIYHRELHGAIFPKKVCVLLDLQLIRAAQSSELQSSVLRPVARLSTELKCEILADPCSGDQTCAAPCFS